MTAPDPAVRSIRIATTLNERFRDLMHARHSPGDGTAELELRIGEAQQIYPEIWNHLDDARKVIAERGGDTAVYDQIKAAQGPARLGVTRVEVEDHFSQFGLDHVQTKEAHFNLEGFRSAHKACAALMATMPEVDWKAIERAENQEIAAAGSLGPVSSTKTLQWLAIAAALLGVTYAFWYLVIRIPPVDPAEREAKAQAARTERIATYRAQADAEPCDEAVQRELAGQLYWEKPPGQDREARRHYREQCDRRIVELTAQLDANPCDTATLDRLATSLRARKPAAARAATATYRDLCASSKSGPPAPP